MKHFLISIITLAALIGCGGAEERKEVYLEKARQSMEAGNLDKARIELKNVLQIDPKDAQAYYHLGNVLEQQTEYLKAFRYYLKAEELDPDNLEYHAKIGNYYLVIANDINKAIEKKDFILGKEVSNVAGLILKAGILIKQNDVAGAKKITRDIFSKHPDNIENAIFLAAINSREKEYEDSIHVLNICRNYHPDNIVLASTLADTFVMAEHYEQAENIYKDILMNDFEVFSMHLKLATFYQKIGELDKAEDVLRKAIKEDEEDSSRKLVFVAFIQKTKGVRDAIYESKAIIEKNPEIGDIRLILAKLYMADNNLDDAEKVLKSAISIFPTNSIGINSRVYLANLYMLKGNIDAATSIINDAIKESPNDTGVNFARAKLQLQSKDYDGAIISLRTVIKDAPEMVDAYFLLSAAHQAKGEEQYAGEIIDQAYENNRTNKATLMALIKYHSRNRNITKLERIIDYYLSNDVNNYEVLSLKTALLNQQKKFSEAKAYALRMIEVYPDMPNGYIQAVPNLLAENKINEATSLLDNGYKKVQDNDRLLELLVSLHIANKNFDAAENKVQAAIREKGEIAQLYMLLAKIQLPIGAVESAKKNLVKASVIKPSWHEPYFVLSNIYMAEKQSQKAIDILLHGLMQSKGNLKLTFALSKIYESLGNYADAIREYEKAYEKHSNNLILANNIASILSNHFTDEENMKRAKELAGKLKNSDQAVMLDTAGWVYYNIGDYVEAVSILRRVIEKSPDIAVFNYHLGMALFKAGDKASAKIYLASSIANNSDFSGNEDAKAHLQKLQ